MHGKTSMASHDDRGILAGLPNPLRVGRYHSLCVNNSAVPDVLETSARTDRNEIMAVRHRDLPIEGVQFHPESVLMPDGEALMHNFMRQ